MSDDRRTAFEALYAAHGRPVLAYALRRVTQPADAEDVVAETFLVAWRKLADAPTPPDALLPWLYAIARRVLANQRRANDRRARLQVRVRQVPAVVGLATEDDQDGPAIAALSRLRPDDQELLRLVAWEELSHAQIAVVLGITPNAVAIRVHRARARFEGVLRDVEQDHVKGIDPGRTSKGLKGRMFGWIRREQAK